MSATWVGLVGTLVGGLLVGGFNAWNDRQRGLRERRRWFDEKSLAAIVAFLQASHAFRAAFLYQPQDLDALQLRFLAVSEELDLVAPGLTAAASGVFKILAQMRVASGDPQRFAPLTMEYVKARDAFLEAAQREIAPPKGRSVAFR